MQFKLLNNYKMISKIACSLVGAFSVLIVYEATQSLIFTGVYLLAKNIIRLICGLTMRKQIQRHPEIFLMLRMVVIGLYCFSLTIISQYVILGCFLAALLSGVDASFQMIAEETLFNYASSQNMDSKRIARTRVFEELGYFAGVIAGGLILDVNQIVVYALCIVIYLIAICPLFIFYLRNKKNPTFNKEYVSNMYESVTKSDTKLPKMKHLITMLLLSYTAIYLCYSISDAVSGIFNLGLFVESDISYSYASVFIIIFRLAFLVGNLVVSYLDKKFDLLNVVRVSCWVISLSFVGLCFVKNVWILYICFALFGFFYASICCFVLQRFVQKTRILGQSNNAFMVRELSGAGGLSIGFVVFLVFILLDLSIFWYFLYCALMLIVTSFVIPALEEKTRRMLVDFVEDNEINPESIARNNEN